MSDTLPPPVPATFQSPPEPKKTSGMAVASLILGILSLLGAALLIVPTVLAIVLGHMSFNRIKKDPTLKGKGLAMAGFIMGYVSIPFTVVLVGLLAAMAIPAFQKVREASLQKTMQNDARQIAAAAQQVMLENGGKSVTFHIDPATGTVTGPIASYVPHLTKGTTEVDGVIESPTDSFSLHNPHMQRGREVVFGADGRQQ